MSDNFDSQLSNEEVIYITLLMGMYNDNLTQIQNLTNSNNTIRDALLETVRRVGNQRAARTSVLNVPPVVADVSTPVTPVGPPPSNPLMETPRAPSPVNFLNNPYSVNSYLSRPRRLFNSQQRSSNRQQSGNMRNSIFSNPQDILQTYLIPAWTTTTNTNNTNNTNGNNVNYIDSFDRIFETFFQPVQIYPTQTQIETAVRRVRYGDIVAPLSNSCPISLEAFNDDSVVSMIRHCRHIFNPDELTNWFRTNCRCPVCRYDIRSYVSEHERTPE